MYYLRRCSVENFGFAIVDIYFIMTPKYLSSFLKSNLWKKYWTTPLNNALKTSSSKLTCCSLKKHYRSLAKVNISIIVEHILDSNFFIDVSTAIKNLFFCYIKKTYI